MPPTGSQPRASAPRSDTPPVVPEAEPAPEPAALPGAPPLAVILGPTASGKTGFAIQAAQALHGEIVSADSRQIYRLLDIGTAKPTPADRAAVPHHLIDVADPDEVFTLAQYQRAAAAAIQGIHRRGLLPLLVGGTGQYISAVIEGWNIPEVAPNPTLRAELEQFAADQGARALHDRLRAADPTAADRIDYRNVRRVVRALEVVLETGTPISVLQRKQPPPYHIVQIGLTMPREALYARADARLEGMIAAGLREEVRGLLEAGYTWDSPALTGLGYVQWRPVFDAGAAEADAIAAIRRETRAYIRRQYTWFNGHDTGIHWFDVQAAPAEPVIGRLHEWLSP